MATIEEFAERVQRDEIAGLVKMRLDCEANINNAKTSIKVGTKYTKVDVGYSGRYMVENATGNIYGIKAYGVVHRGHPYGNLSNIEGRVWGRYL